ncbi:alpha/beta fold hydrolase [Ferviditalea candida]|uniref:Alpha/beta hydrolase n=1 Tax=Ferviditalea candida TaxID=3108399 RepID=A0ABU5ZI00_9BACL|nr:alpha/beta hydrolase [Paenibacillaceae bacterium T2]
MNTDVSYSLETIDVRGLRVRLYRAGKGEPLLWLHGANGGGWNPFLQQLSSRYEVLAPEHPGFGQSDLPDWFDSIEDMAFHYRDFLDTLGYERVTICGSSLGGWIGLQLALIQAHRVKKLIVSDVAGVHIPGRDSIDPFTLTVPQLTERCFYDTSRLPKTPQLSEMPVEMIRNRAMFARLTWERGCDPKLLHRLGGLSVPVLIVWGRQDELVPLSSGEKLKKAIPDSELFVIDECGHLPYVEKPEDFLNRIASFI